MRVLVAGTEGVEASLGSNRGPRRDPSQQGCVNARRIRAAASRQAPRTTIMAALRRGREAKYTPSVYWAP